MNTSHSLASFILDNFYFLDGFLKKLSLPEVWEPFADWLFSSVTESRFPLHWSSLSSLGSRSEETVGNEGILYFRYSAYLLGKQVLALQGPWL